MGISATEARWKGGNDGRVGPGRPGVEGREELVSRTRETQTAAKPTESQCGPGLSSSQRWS